MVKNLPANAADIRDRVLIPGSRRSPGEGHGNQLQYSSLVEDPRAPGPGQALAGLVLAVFGGRAGVSRPESGRRSCGSSAAHQVPLSMEFFQARTLEWVAISYSRGSFRPRNQTRVSCVSCPGRQILYHYTTWKPLIYYNKSTARRTNRTQVP